jgi:CRP-like cAMP-binding protein
LLAVLGPANIFGEMALFDPGPRTSAVITVAAVHAMTMNRDAVWAWSLSILADRGTAAAGWRVDYDAPTPPCTT